ncbi:unnamed protein product [Ilex paraguariensis]|uniref:Argonaute 2 n=1 Tax=Ilex paraguariensis TaxID=185542 RepID=A0ABC8UM92_9AQUA
MERSNYNRGSGGAGRGGYGGGDRGGGHNRGGGCRDGNYPHPHYQQQDQHQGGGDRGGGRRRGGGGHVGNYPNQQYQQQDQYQGGADRGGRRGRGTGTSPIQNGGDQWVIRPGQTGKGGGEGRRPPQEIGHGVWPTRAEPTEGCGRGGYGGAAGRGRRFRRRPTSVPGQLQYQTQDERVPEQTLPVISLCFDLSLHLILIYYGHLDFSKFWLVSTSSDDMKALRWLIVSSEQKSPSTIVESTERVFPIKRPDKGGTLAVRSARLFANHFPVRFNPESTILHYDVDIKPDMSLSTHSSRKSIPKSDLRLIRDKLFSDNPTRFPLQMTAYDGEKNIFSAVSLPTGHFKVELSDGDDKKSRLYTFTIKLVNELKFCKLKDYLSGKLPYIPRDILQGMDLVMKENPSRNRISVGRSFYSREFMAEDDLYCGIAAFRGFQQGLKATSQGLALCLDYSVWAFRKRLSVIDFLKEHVRGFREVNDVKRLIREVTSALEGLKVTVTHRATKQKYTIEGLTSKNTRHTTFILEDREGKNSPREIGVVEYFREKYNKEIMYKDIPCLDLERSNKKNYVPMEFCILVEGQRYPKEQLDRDTGLLLKKISLAPPKERKKTICEMVQAEDGPCGEVARNFDIAVEKNITRVLGRVIQPPDLKVRSPSGNMKKIKVDREKCQWNIVGKYVVEGILVERWALIDFSSFDRYKLNSGNFIQNLRNRCRNLGVRMEEPVVCRFTGMHEFSSLGGLQELFEGVVKEASRKCKGGLQIVVCVMTAKHPGYKYLKWVSEIQVGVITQCCLVSYANKGNDQYLANLALKINAKLGGSNVELIERLPRFEGEEPVMFVGADVNHPAARNSTCPSIAAVVATMNWPAANRYAARVCPQNHRKEKILNFGTMCLDLVNTYAQLNKVKPKKIVVFRDGVSEGQFAMVLNEELLNLKMAIYEEHYRPTITLVIARKRHQTRLFLENEREGGGSGNVPPGTVVDTTIVHPFEFDFYLCSHYGSLGTSKPTHYYVLWDEHNFTSDQLQRLIYNLCFTYARCTKPVSLVPPVYYADLVAYRGRIFQEVVMEFQSPSVSSSSSGTSSSSSAASLNERFYKLHPDLQNVMFFV